MLRVMTGIIFSMAVVVCGCSSAPSSGESSSSGSSSGGPDTVYSYNGGDSEGRVVFVEDNVTKQTVTYAIYTNFSSPGAAPETGSAAYQTAAGFSGVYSFTVGTKPAYLVKKNNETAAFVMQLSSDLSTICFLNKRYQSNQIASLPSGEFPFQDISKENSPYDSSLFLNLGWGGLINIQGSAKVDVYTNTNQNIGLKLDPYFVNSDLTWQEAYSNFAVVNGGNTNLVFPGEYLTFVMPGAYSMSFGLKMPTGTAPDYATLLVSEITYPMVWLYGYREAGTTVFKSQPGYGYCKVKYMNGIIRTIISDATWVETNYLTNVLYPIDKGFTPGYLLTSTNFSETMFVMCNTNFTYGLFFKLRGSKSPSSDPFSFSFGVLLR